MAKKTRKTTPVADVKTELKANMIVSVDTTIDNSAAADAAALSELLSELDGDNMLDMAMNSGEGLLVPVGDDDALEAVLEAALADGGLEHGDEGGAEIKVDAPDEKPAKQKKEKKAKEPKAPKEPKERSALRDHFATPSQKVAAHLGDAKGEYLLLNMDDAMLEGEALVERQASIAAMLDDKNPKTWKLAQKEKEKAVMLFGYLKKGGQLNEVMRRAFTLLINEGELTSGDKGNLQQDLLKKPYSIGTARSQANQMFGLFQALEIVTKSEKGKFVANPDSLILAKVKGMLGLQ